jgi:hypothetical protein
LFVSIYLTPSSTLKKQTAFHLSGYQLLHCGKEEKKEGRKEGRKEGTKERRKEGREKINKITTTSCPN